VRLRRTFDLSQPKPQSKAPTDVAAPNKRGGWFGLLLAILSLSKLRAWAAGYWWRRLTVATTILLLIAITMAGWAYLASIALRTGRLSLDPVLKAYDEGRYNEARAAVGRMLKSGRLPRSEYGGPLFVLGAIKTHDAENQSTAQRRRVEYLVASRYLNEAQTYGIPADRKTEAAFLLGKSLVESSQFDHGIEKLEELVATGLPKGHPLAWEVHRLLANTCLLMPEPDLQQSLRHNDALLAKGDLTDQQRAGVLLQRAECLARMNRFDEARQAAAGVPPAANRAPEVALLQGKIALDEVLAAVQRVATSDRQKILSDSQDKVAGALERLQQAKSLDDDQGQITRQASYHIARGTELHGDNTTATKQFARTRQLFGDTFEGLAAALAEADLLRQQGDFEGALLGYRHVLESFASASTYRSVVMPLAAMRERMMAGLKDFVRQKRFADALALLDDFTPMFSRTEQLEVRGDTLEQWGAALVSDASENDPEAATQRNAGYRHWRAAGVAFEQLADLRFATKFYTGDLWHSAENYFRGHSFTRAVRLLDKYLEHEPELRNAQALLRLGQAHLALGQIPESIAAFEECIEFHPLDSSTYQARIDCAKAYWNMGNTSRAEQLLQENITGTSLKPSSREWKDSLFELGMLQHDMGQFENSIGTLEQAIERYEHDSQRLLAQYVIGDSYRRWAQELLERVPQVRTTSERDKNKEAAIERLETALEHFEAVQVSITLTTHDIHSDPMMGAMLRNCYMLEGTVLFDLAAQTGSAERYKEAIVAFSNVSSLYPDEPFVLETFVQIANCWRRLGVSEKARGSIQQAQMALDRLPATADFAGSTAFSRDEWRMLLADMSRW
jgi:tetratricopeptide (TPR) repeat protein